MMRAWHKEMGSLWRPANWGKLFLLAALLLLGVQLKALPVHAADTYSVSGTKILKNGVEFIPNGVNINGPNWVWPRESTQDADLIVNDWKFNMVRVNGFINVQSGSWSTNNNTDTIVNAFTSRGAVVMFEAHDQNGSFFTSSSSPSLTDVQNYWIALANKYKNNPAVWFNIHNEPGTNAVPLDPQWKVESKAIIQAIRSTGATNIIVVDGTSWGNDTGSSSTGNVQTTDSSILSWGQEVKAADTTGNTMFSFHLYGGWDFAQAKMDNYVDQVHGLGLALMAGEYGMTNSGQYQQDVTDIMNVSTSKHVGKLAWHWDGGDDFDLTTNSASGGGGWGMDKTDGTKPTNLTTYGSLVWDNTHTTASSGGGTNLIVNGGFESGTSPWSLSASYSLSTQSTHSGANSVKLIGTQGYSNMTQTVTVTPNTDYKLTFWANSGASVIYKVMTTGWANLVPVQFTTVNNTWTQYSMSFNSGNNTSILICTTDNGTGTSYLDDFALSAVSTIVVNGGFESGTSPWSLSASYSLSTQSTHSGANSVKLIGTQGYSNMTQTITVTPNTNYTFTFWANCGASIVYKVMTTGWANLLPDQYTTTANNTWTQYSLSFNSGNNTSLLICTTDNGTGTSYLDDFAVN